MLTIAQQYKYNLNLLRLKSNNLKQSSKVYMLNKIILIIVNYSLGRIIPNLSHIIYDFNDKNYNKSLIFFKQFKTM